MEEYDNLHPDTFDTFWIDKDELAWGLKLTPQGEAIIYTQVGQQSWAEALRIPKEVMDDLSE